MKKTILILTLLAATMATQAQNTRPATVEQHSSGLFVFVDSKPTDQYEVIGENKIYIIWSGTAKAIQKKHIRKIKRKFPNANGIIWSTEETEIATVIKFK